MAVLTTACRRWLVAAGCVVLVGIFALVRWALDQPLDGDSKAVERRPTEYEIANGMSIRYRHLRADSVSFKACRMRRRRMGAFALGAFRVLELEDVRLNLPLPAETGAVAMPVEKPAEGPAGDAKAPSAPASRKRSLDEVLGKIGLSGVGRFSGVMIRGLRVGRMTDTGANPLFSAMEAETRGAVLTLSQCAVFRDGKWEFVPKARLDWKGKPRLVWPDGSLDLPELQETTR